VISIGVDVAAGEGVPGADTVFSTRIGTLVGGRVFVGRIYDVDVARIGVAVSVGCINLVGMGTVAVRVAGGAAHTPCPLRMTARMPHRLTNNNRLRQPITAVPTRLESNILLMAFIPWFLYDIVLVLSATQIIRRTASS
jgi:hypothetical protein